MKNVRSSTLARLGTTLVVMMLLGGCLTPSGEPVPTADSPESGTGSSGTGGSGTGGSGTGNTAPTIQGSPASGISVGQVYTFVPSASDPDGDSLIFSVTNLPAWASFDESTGRLSGQPTLTDEGTFTNITISVTDGQASTSMRPFSIAVTQQSLGSATLTLLAPATNTDGTAFTDLTAFKLYFGTTRGNYPNEIWIDNPGISDYVVENLAPATYYFVATAINSSGMESSYSNEITRIVD